MSKPMPCCASKDTRQIWHITQRCHKSRFLLDDEVDRLRWRYWLYQAKRRYRLSVLNYVATSNHVHLLIQGNGSATLRECMSFINARTAADFQRWHAHRDPIWESSFQLTAVQNNAHLARCMTYIDMNMVRAGAVTRPEFWQCGGYHESLNPSRRCSRIDHTALQKLLGFANVKAMHEARRQWIDDQLSSAELSRVPYWTDSVAVGDLAFALKMKRAFAFALPKGRAPLHAQREHGCYAVREATPSYVA